MLIRNRCVGQFDHWTMSFSKTNCRRIGLTRFHPLISAIIYHLNSSFMFHTEKNFTNGLAYRDVHVIWIQNHCSPTRFMRQPHAVYFVARSSFRSKFWRVFSLSVMPSHSKISLSLITHLTPLQPSFYLNLHSHTLSLSLWVQDSRMGTYYNGGRPAARKPKYSWKQTDGQSIVVFQIQRANQRITRTKIRERESQVVCLVRMGV